MLSSGRIEDTPSALSTRVHGIETYASPLSNPPAAANTPKSRRVINPPALCAATPMSCSPKYTCSSSTPADACLSIQVRKASPTAPRGVVPEEAPAAATIGGKEISAIAMSAMYTDLRRRAVGTRDGVMAPRQSLLP